MLFLPKHFRLSLILMFLCNIGIAQKVTKMFYKDSVGLYSKQDTFYTNKNIPFEFKDAIQIALQFYPELSKTNIKFRIRKNQISTCSKTPHFGQSSRKHQNENIL